MKRPVVGKNRLSTSLAIAAFAAPNLVRAFAQSLSHYGNPLPGFFDAEGTQHRGFWAPPTMGQQTARSPRPLYATRAMDIHRPINQPGSLCSNPVISLCLVRNIR
jgi:hypothetical protein